VTRLVLAGLVTLAVLPYTWGRTLVLWMLVGQPEPWCLGLLIAGLVAVMLLTFRLAHSFSGTRFPQIVLAVVATTWAVEMGILVALRAGALLPRPYVVSLFVPATLWVVWVAWMFFLPMRGWTRLGILAVLSAGLAVFLLLLKVEGLSGDSQINFTWRQGAAPPALAGGEMLTTAGTVDLAHTGPVDYPQFLGPMRLGVLPAARLARDWEKRPPRRVWQQPLGAGWGAFAVVNGYGVTQEQRGPDECVVCYRLADGAMAWIHRDAGRFDGSMGGPGPRATPTIADGRVYSVGATGLLNCLDGATGRRLWSVNILQDNEAANIAHGVCASPLVVGDWIVVCPTGSSGPSLAAYRRDNGQRVWRAGHDQASYSSPLLAELSGRRQILLFGSAGVAGHDAATGQVLWSFPWTNDVRVNVAQPIANAGGPDQVFLSTGYGQGSVLLRVGYAAEGGWTVAPLWKSRQMKTKFTTAVVHKDHIYGLDDGMLECVDLGTGKRLWKDGRYEHGQILLAGDLLLVQAENGEVVLVEAVPERLRELGRVTALTSKTWNHPVLAGRLLLVRNDQEAACFELPPAE
jgi:outer membrane protein assembly factor BamB